MYVSFEVNARLLASVLPCLLCGTPLTNWILQIVYLEHATYKIARAIAQSANQKRSNPCFWQYHYLDVLGPLFVVASFVGVDAQDLAGLDLALGLLPKFGAGHITLAVVLPGLAL